MGKHNKTRPACGRKMKNRPNWRDDLQLYRPAALFLWYELEKGHRVFERTPDMVFALERRTVHNTSGKKTKQFPVIRGK